MYQVIESFAGVGCCAASSWVHFIVRGYGLLISFVLYILSVFFWGGLV